MEARILTSTSAGAQGWSAPGDFRNVRVHMVGIGGCGMAGLAAVLLHRKAHVTGTDRAVSAVTQLLVAKGARVATEQNESSLPVDTEFVVASAAIKPDHPEIVAARRCGIPVLKYAQLLGALMRAKHGVAVAGTHGKSTTTAWLTHALRLGKLDPTFVVGAECQQLGGGSGVGDGDHFVAEACEYDHSFLNLHPKAAAILNIEEDHLDYYKDLAAIRDAFGEFAERVPPTGLVVLNGDDEHCRSVRARLNTAVETIGLDAANDWHAANHEVRDGRHAFDIVRDGVSLGRVELTLAGMHNVRNALAVAALATFCGVPWNDLATALNEFRGVNRRLELRGIARGVTILDDYAHHPTEIRATLSAVRERFSPRRLWCVFQPHQHSRTRFLLEDFARSFAQADFVVMPRIYFVRDSEREREAVCASDLVDRIAAGGGDATFIPEFSDIVDRLIERVEPGDVVVTMGAGDIWKVSDELVQRV